MVKLGVAGVGGRMGIMILKEIENRSDTVIGSGLVRSGSSLVGSDLGTIASRECVGVAATDNAKQKEGQSTAQRATETGAVQAKPGAAEKDDPYGQPVKGNRDVQCDSDGGYDVLLPSIMYNEGEDEPWEYA